MLKVAVVGASGYTGGELLRILAAHPRVRIAVATSEQSRGKAVETVFPNLRGHLSLKLQSLNLSDLAPKADLFFLALPHTTGMPVVSHLLKKKKKVIDLSADFRLKDSRMYEQWYGTKHLDPDLCSRACYGLPEIHRKSIRKARLIANPGCYPTGAILGLLPLMAQSLPIPGSIIIDAKSGVTGAGRTLSQTTQFSEANEAVSAYSVGRHRHMPEIEQELSGLAGQSVMLTFAPHLIPVNRGILSTIYVRLKKQMTPEQLAELYQKRYLNEPFVQVLPPGELPNTRNVRGSNHCHIGITADTRSHRTGNWIIIVTAIDNLVKGAAGQAVQNMNIMMGYEESLGLTAAGLFP